MTHPDRLRAVRRLALSGGDSGLARECESELTRSGHSWDDAVVEQAQELVVPSKRPRRSN
jgi:hypothetical protein